MKGKLIVLYGINNIGKSTQAHLIIDYLKEKGYQAEYLKYPVYNLEPTGPKINSILRENQFPNISEEELQKLYTQNRIDYEPELKKKLEQGIFIIAEDYRWTGTAWGSCKGANEQNLIEANKNLYDEDLIIFMEGKRFLIGVEKNHVHENNHDLAEQVRLKLNDYAKKFNWLTVNANQSKEQVFAEIKKILEENLDL